MAGRHRQPDADQLTLNFTNEELRRVASLIRSINDQIAGLGERRWVQVREVLISILYRGGLTMAGCRASRKKVIEGANEYGPVITSRDQFKRAVEAAQAAGLLVQERLYNGGPGSKAIRWLVLERVEDLVEQTRKRGVRPRCALSAPSVRPRIELNLTQRKPPPPPPEVDISTDGRPTAAPTEGPPPTWEGAEEFLRIEIRMVRPRPALAEAREHGVPVEQVWRAIRYWQAHHSRRNWGIGALYFKISNMLRDEPIEALWPGSTDRRPLPRKYNRAPPEAVAARVERDRQRQLQRQGGTGAAPFRTKDRAQEPIGSRSESAHTPP
jgi:hypothetical protein